MSDQANEVRRGYLVVYADAGPGGPCGQSMSVTCPHAYVSIFDTYEDAQKAIQSAGGRIGRNGLRRLIVRGELDGGPLRLFDHRRAADAELARVTEDRDRLRAACEECLKVVDECYEATGHIRAARTSEQRLRIEAALNPAPAGEGGASDASLPK